MTLQRGYKYNSPNTRTPLEQLVIIKTKTELFSEVNTQLEQYYSTAISKATVFSQGNDASYNWAKQAVNQHERYCIYNYDYQSPFSMIK